ncbi:hypothetical protein BCR44DRAFT_1425707 [Catenaria anguillulae PL171]|uniref:Uncharacterized protein n=1 Tax=Catenaria anguillulae PL171 TaxID=765915 RepID=A0A1Y2HZ19_9FUNG|nr:hypothetical protein BCR44DRAFT_1425707 [Catenaria anguillulae PL171]
MRAPTGNAAVDSVMAVERKSELVVLASTNMRDVFVFLRPGGSKWSWSNEHAPGMLIASGRPMDMGMATSELVGPLTMKIQVAPGVDGRIILALVVAGVTHFQAY